MPEPIGADEVKITPPAPPADEKNDKPEAPAGSEPAKTPAEEDLGSGIKTYDERFKKVYGQMKVLERENETLKNTPKKDEPLASDDWQPKTWDEVLDKAEERILTKTQKEQQKMAEVSAKITADIAEAKKLYPDLSEDEVWDYMDKNKVLNVHEAVIKMHIDKPPSNAKNKQTAAKIGAGTAGKTAKTISYAELHNKSLDDINLPS